MILVGRRTFGAQPWIRPVTGRVPLPASTKVIAVLAVLFLVLLLACALAPWLGRDTSDAHREQSRPGNGWFPPLQPH